MHMALYVSPDKAWVCENKQIFTLHLKEKKQPHYKHSTELLYVTSKHCTNWVVQKGPVAWRASDFSHD